MRAGVGERGGVLEMCAWATSCVAWRIIGLHFREFFVTPQVARVLFFSTSMLLRIYLKRGEPSFHARRNQSRAAANFKQAR